jgi:hypothetical protein
MTARTFSLSGSFRWAALLICVALARPTLAQDAAAVETFRGQYDALMSNFEARLAAQGDAAGLERVRRGRAAMQALTDDQLAAVFGHSQIPDLSPAVAGSRYRALPPTSGAAAGGSVQLKSPGFPEPDTFPAECVGVDIDKETRYGLFIAKEVANSVLAAAAWVCNEDILGENGSAACIPLAIAADIANGFYDAATFCSGEVAANQVDANFRRLDHIHNDLTDDVATIVNNDNANAAAIVNNDNSNTAAIVGNDNANTATIVTNDNANTTTIMNNDNANTTAIIANANANKNELRDLILRTQIEADLAMTDNAAVVMLYAVPTANGGYLDLVAAIVTDTIAKIQAAGGSVGNGPSILTSANAAKASGDFKGAYALYRKAYKAAGK